MRHRILSASTLFLAAACGAPAPDSVELGASQQPIVNGTTSEEPNDDTAVYVRGSWSAEAVICTGTLIAPNLVATALHCITQTPSGACTADARECFTCNPDGSITGNNNLGRIGPMMDPSAVSVVVGSAVANVPATAYAQRLIGSGSSQICRGDIGFIVLDRDLDAPISAVRLDWGVKAGDTIRILGYGQTEQSGTSGRRARAGVRVVEVGPASEDEPTISAAPRTFVVNEGPCHGDSGGPALSEETGALVGVYSLTAGEICTGIGVRNVYTHLSLFSSIALQAFDAAGHEPILDEKPAEEEKPALVPESGCSLSSDPASRRGAGVLLMALAALGALRRRRG